MDSFLITYQLQTTAQDVDTLARSIAVEQTVEMPEELITDDGIKTHIIGEVLSKQQKADNQFEVLIRYSADIACFELPQLLNLLYGNISLLPGIKVTHVQIPEQFVAQFTGPRWGIEGIRTIVEVSGRPLLATALKPLGSSAETLADICYQFAAGGLDIIKDDHSLANQEFCSFEERVRLCSRAVRKAESKTGKKTLYFPNVTGRVEDLAQRIELAIICGAGGIVLSPFVIGLDVARSLIDRYGDKLPFMAHPALSGAFSQENQGLAPGVLLGTLSRLAGFDATIFPHFGGRFPFTKETCQDITNACRP